MSAKMVGWYNCPVTDVGRGAWDRTMGGETIVHYWNVTVELEPDREFTFPVYTSSPPHVGELFDVTVERSQP